MAGVRDINGDILELWERAETEHGVPYYINHLDESTQWDHPAMEKLIEDLEHYTMVKYAAYRTALKITKIQKSLNLDAISLDLIITSFETTTIFSTATQKNISCYELQQFILEIFTTSQSQKRLVLTVDYNIYAELLTNLLLDICDLCRKKGKVPVLYLKVYLTVLCSDRLPDKYRYIFSLFSDSSNRINEIGLTKLFHILAEIPEFLFEGSSFGSKLVAGAVRSCFANSADDSALSEDSFLEWLLREPQNLVWLSTLTRLKAAERVRHDVKCKVCKRYPIFGFRYTCLKCLNYDQCQQCFFLGFHNKNHKLTHPVQEYCRVANPREETKALLKKLRNKLKIKPMRNLKKRYLPISISNASLSIGDSVIENRFYEQECESIVAGKVSKILQTDDFLWEGSRILVQSAKKMGKNPVCDLELESIIVHLEDENRNFIKEVEELNRRSAGNSSCSSSSCGEAEEELAKNLMEAQNTVFQEHNQQIHIQVQRLRQLLQHAQQKSSQENEKPSENNSSDPISHMQSTPTSAETHASFKNVSPIEMLHETVGKVSTTPTKKSEGVDVQTRRSLRRKVLAPKQINQNFTLKAHSITPPCSSKLTTFNQSKSVYALSDMTVSMRNSTFKGTSSEFTLPHYKSNMAGSNSQNELQEVIEQLENIAPI